jgi:hypothetical protein
MLLKPKYGVRFVGYSADVFAKKNGREVEYAMLDFAFGTTRVSVEGGWVIARDFRALMHDLPNVVAELEELLEELASSPGGKAWRGPYSATQLSEQSSGDQEISIAISTSAEIRVRTGVVFGQFIRKAVKRFEKVEPVIEQARIISNSIDRPSYDEYVEEIAKTGIARVEYYGLALFIDGNLRFYPERRTLLMQPQEDNALLVQGLERRRPSVN